MMLSFAEALSWTCFLHLTLCYIFPAYSSRVSSCRFWCICNNSRKPHTQGSAITAASTKSGVLDLHCFRHSLYLWLKLTPKFFSFSTQVYILKLKTKAWPIFTGMVWHSSVPQSLCNGQVPYSKHPLQRIWSCQICWLKGPTGCTGQPTLGFINTPVCSSCQCWFFLADQEGWVIWTSSCDLGMNWHLHSTSILVPRLTLELCMKTQPCFRPLHRRPCHLSFNVHGLGNQWSG